jgi:hypothetical protein
MMDESFEISRHVDFSRSFHYHRTVLALCLPSGQVTAGVYHRDTESAAPSVLPNSFCRFRSSDWPSHVTRSS